MVVITIGVHILSSQGSWYVSVMIHSVVDFVMMAYLIGVEWEYSWRLISLKLDAVSSRNSSFALAAPTEAPSGPSGKSQAGSERTACSCDRAGLVSPRNTCAVKHCVCPADGGWYRCVCSLSARALTRLPGFWESRSDHDPPSHLGKVLIGVKKYFQGSVVTWCLSWNTSIFLIARMWGLNEINTLKYK